MRKILSVIAIPVICSVLLVTGLCLLVYYTIDSGKYAPGFTEDKFRLLRLGMKQSDVLSLLGEPLHKYCSETSTYKVATTNGLLIVTIDYTGRQATNWSNSFVSRRGVFPGLRQDCVEKRIGAKPIKSTVHRRYWQYAEWALESPTMPHRDVVFEGGLVTRIINNDSQAP